MAANTQRAGAVTLAVRLEALTIVWMAAEALLAIVAGVAARSVLLTAFGFDSVVELLSGIVLFWRLSVEAGGANTDQVDRLERRTARISAVLLIMLCAFVVVTSLGGMLAGVRPEGSALGIAVAAAALIGMPLLALAKNRVNRQIGSASLRADIAETITCAYMAGVTLAGVALSMLLGTWWVQYLAALLLLIWLVQETREALEGAQGERHSGDSV